MSAIDTCQECYDEVRKENTEQQEASYYTCFGANRICAWYGKKCKDIDSVNDL